MNLPNDKLLIVFEMANNHMGCLDHGMRIIHAMNEARQGFDFHFAIKFQYRHLDTFIHPDYRERRDIKYVERFSRTRLQPGEFLEMKREAERLGFISACTPFDESSVDLVVEHDFAIIKIASCSFTDWPLLERIAQTDKPIIASTAGVPLEDLDKVVSFLDHRKKTFALLHCIAQYPTPGSELQINQLRFLQGRYPRTRIGFSTHELPDRTDSVKMAIAAGATIFEKHVGLPTPEHKLNDYSASPPQVRTWLQAARESVAICGETHGRHPFQTSELASLRALRRGVFARQTIPAGERIRAENVFLAIPVGDGQLTANDLSKYTEFHVQTDIPANAPVLFSNVRQADSRQRVFEIVQRVKKLLAQSGVVIPGRADLEISHHYGLEKFDEFGITMITVVNREYCKKLIIVLPGQSHPEQDHRQKEETFHVLWGDIQLRLDGRPSEQRKGDVVVLEAGVKHSFSSQQGAVIEEISSTHHLEDSYYTDPAIISNKDRKTLLTYWMD